ncbi:MAG TPA: hemerythrin family protein [Bacteroidales bacterium]|nr:hemerythrin family protein [Bacteroidales bacterium]
MENWSTKFILNIPEIDSQHNGFFELWDKELKLIDASNEDQLVFIIEKMENYIKDHFTAEENLLIKSGYIDLENHIIQHQFFIQKINEMKLELNYKNALLFEKIALFMKKWFLSHIMQFDKKYQETVLSY